MNFINETLKNSKLLIITAGLSCLLFLVSCNKTVPVNEQIRKSIEKLSFHGTISAEFEIHCAKSVSEAYRKNKFKPIWTNSLEIVRFIHIIQHCEEEGLNPNDYQLSTIELFQNTKKLLEDRMQLDILLTDTFFLYASHLSSGKIDPSVIDITWPTSESDKDIAGKIFEIKNKGIRSVISDIQPKITNYQALKSQLKKYLSMKKRKIDWPPIKYGKRIEPGKTDKHISEIRERLTLVSDYLTAGHKYSDVYDEHLKAAVIDFQRQHGLEAKGIIGKETIEALNLSLDERINTIKVNLERLRWLPRDFPKYYIIVNIADFNLEVIKDNSVLANYKVIVGNPARQTPVFASTIQHIVFNPTWTVPPTILKKDVIPAIQKSETYLTERSIQVYDQKGMNLNPSSIDWKDKKVYGYTYKQEPGKVNALGVVKFVFPNDNYIYLHDTPRKDLFKKTQRPFSSGCIRVHNALNLAEILLKDQPRWNKRTIYNVVKSSGTQIVELKSKPDVYLIYLTAWATDSNEMHFRKDIYNRDEVLFYALHSTSEENTRVASAFKNSIN